MVYLINVGFGLVDCMVYVINIGFGLVDCMIYLINVGFGLVALSVIPDECTVWVGCLVDYTPVDQNQTNRRRIASGLFLFATKNKENCVMGKDNEKYNLPVQYLLFNYAGGLHIKLWPDPCRISWLIISENHTTIHYANLTTIYLTNLTTIHYTNLNTIHYTNPTTIHYTNPTTTHYTNPTTTNLIARAWMGGISMSQRKCCFHSLRRFMWKMIGITFTSKTSLTSHFLCFLLYLRFCFDHGTVYFLLCLFFFFSRKLLLIRNQGSY